VRWVREETIRIPRGIWAPVRTETIYNLPANGGTIYVTLYSLVGGQWLSNRYTYVSGP